jgi:ribosome-binding factor A
MDPRRSERLAETLRVELEELINYELDDPRVSTVAVTEVLLSPDGKKAHVRIAIEGNPDRQKECLQAIEKAKGYLRVQLADRVDVFRMPDIRFDTDLPAGLRERAGELLKRIRRGRPRDGGAAGEA